MTGKNAFKYIAISVLSVTILACKEKQPQMITPTSTFTEFNSNSLLIGEKNSTKKVQGQVLYLPVYSNVPYFGYNRKFDLSAFIAIHNTDFKKSIKVTKVLLFNNEGQLVANYLSKDTMIKPLAATDFFVPENNRHGTGANFIVEWISDTLVNEPLVESVMIGLTSGQGVSFSSAGKIIREMK